MNAETQIAWLYPQSFCFIWCKALGLILCIANRFPAESNVAGPGRAPYGGGCFRSFPLGYIMFLSSWLVIPVYLRLGDFSGLRLFKLKLESLQKTKKICPPWLIFNILIVKCLLTLLSQILVCASFYLKLCCR
jgi:hypothetical protein